MTRSERRTRLSALAALLTAACASFDPVPLDSVPLVERAVSNEAGGLRVSLAIPTDEEAEALFDADLAGKGIQPVWVEIDNQTGQAITLMELLIDPGYFSPYEAAYMCHRKFAGDANERIDEHFAASSLGGLVFDDGERRSGFVFTNLDRGIKYTDVVFLGLEDLREFPFAIPVPGTEVRTRVERATAAYAEGEWRDFEDGRELLAALEDLPGRTTDPDGSGPGTPLNAVFIGDLLPLRLGLVRARWFDVATVGVDVPEGQAPPEDRRFLPARQRYAFGRPQDASARKLRGRYHQPLNLDLWMAPLRFRGQYVFLCSVTRDRELFGSREWPSAVGEIDPAVDGALSQLAQDLVISEKTLAHGYVRGVGAVTREDAAALADGRPWWTAGLRAVFLMSAENVSLDDVVYFDTTGDFLIGLDAREEAGQ